MTNRPVKYVPDYSNNLPNMLANYEMWVRLGGADCPAALRLARLIAKHHPDHA